jgi:hypothetical protein
MSRLNWQLGRQKKIIAPTVFSMTRKRPCWQSLIAAGQPVFGLEGGFDPQSPSNPIFTVLEIVADFILKINLFLAITAFLFNSYFKEKGLSRILINIFRRKGPRIRGIKCLFAWGSIYTVC